MCVFNLLFFYYYYFLLSLAWLLHPAHLEGEASPVEGKGGMTV